MEPRRVAVVAIGGSAIPAPGGAADDALARVGLGVAELVTRGWRVVVTHASGPYVATAERRAAPDSASRGARDSLDIRMAEAQGALGYRIVTALDAALTRRHRHERACAMLTRVLVSVDDPAFARASEELDAEEGPARIATPKPLRILDVDPIADLLGAGRVVVAAGGGGIAVARDAAGFHHGVEAAVDKDYTSARLAIDLDADLFVLCTDVSHVAVDFDRPTHRDLTRLDDTEAEELLRTHQLGARTMAPKIESALWFLRAPSRHPRSVIVTTPDLMADALVGRSGTHVVASGRTVP